MMTSPAAASPWPARPLGLCCSCWRWRSSAKEPGACPVKGNKWIVLGLVLDTFCQGVGIARSPHSLVTVPGSI